jgi:hypothetical protein
VLLLSTLYHTGYTRDTWKCVLRVRPFLFRARRDDAAWSLPAKRSNDAMDENGRAMNMYFQVSQVSANNIILLVLSRLDLQANHQLSEISY